MFINIFQRSIVRMMVWCRKQGSLKRACFGMGILFSQNSELRQLISYQLSHPQQQTLLLKSEPAENPFDETDERRIDRKGIQKRIDAQILN